MLLRVVGRALKILILLASILLIWVLARTGLRWLWWRMTAGGEPFEPLPNEVLVRQGFESMGPTFIKLGQVVASSPGLFPERYANAFAECLDRVPSFDLATLREIVETDLGAPIEELFVSMEDTPLGSASIAQVHGATLEGGQRVVVKVQRPGIARIVDADIWWMRRGTWILERLFKGARYANLSGVINDFDQTIHEELDFRREADNLREFNAIMAKHKCLDVKAPRPVDGMVSRRVLVMERFFGLKADDIVGIRGAGIDPEIFLRKALRAWLMTMMLHGFFHGDAHAGNLMMLPDGPAVGFLDFGIIGRFNTAQRHQVIRYVLAFVAKDYNAIADVLIEIGAVKTDIDKSAFIQDIERIYGPLLEKSVGQIHYDEILPLLTKVTYRYGLILPRDFLLILKQLLFFDRYAKLAAPTLNVFGDLYLVDFLFSPDALEAGLDFNQLMPLLQKVQAQERAGAIASPREPPNGDDDDDDDDGDDGDDDNDDGGDDDDASD